MTGLARFNRDPFEGKAAHRKRIRVLIESTIALVLALIACGLTAATWLRLVGPALERAFLG